MFITGKRATVEGVLFFECSRIGLIPEWFCGIGAGLQIEVS